MKRWITILFALLMLYPTALAEGPMKQTGLTQPVPAAYSDSSQYPGTVEALTYDTKDYYGDGGDTQKTAYVYLPYGYDPADTEARYNILYLMHGWTGMAGEYFFIGNGFVKNLLDRMIEQGDISPVIVVSPSFYTEDSSRDFSPSVEQLRLFHLDFENALMPAVEGTYHTYATGTSQEELMASRDHRAFGGFSLGSVTTWMQFCHDTDYIRYFLPMSGSCWYYGGYGDFQIERNVDFIEQLVQEKDLEKCGYFIYQAVGTQDSVKSQTLMMADEMLSRSDVFTPEHYVFYQKEDGVHDYNAIYEFMYNALPLFFKD